MIVTLHAVCALAAIVIGPIVLLRRKGDRRHRALGGLFLVTMAGVDLTGFGIYELSGRFSVFHGLALLNALNLWLGWKAARQGRIGEHLTQMAYGYGALLAALGSRLPELFAERWFAPVLIVGLAAPLILTGLLARRMRRRYRGPGAARHGAD